MSVYEILKSIRPEVDYENSSDFIGDGLLDSFDIVSLISEIESEYGIFIDGLDVVPENFQNIQRIEELIIKSGAEI